MNEISGVPLFTRIFEIVSQKDCIYEISYWELKRLLNTFSSYYDGDEVALYLTNQDSGKKTCVCTLLILEIKEGIIKFKIK